MIWSENRTVRSEIAESAKELAEENLINAVVRGCVIGRVTSKHRESFAKRDNDDRRNREQAREFERRRSDAEWQTLKDAVR